MADMRYLLVVSVLALPAVLASTPVTPRYVFPAECLEVTKSSRTTLEAPLKDGQADMANAKLENVLVTYKPGCGRLELK